MFKVYILGNPNFEQDSLPVRLLPQLLAALPNFQFLPLDPTENFPEEEHLILIDTILGIDEVKILTENDLEKIEPSPNYSLHDFDLAFSLKLAKKLGKINKVTIIGVPSQYKESTLQQITNIIKNITEK